MKKLFLYLLIILILFSFCACSNINNMNEKMKESTTKVQENTMQNTNITEKFNNVITIKIGDKVFSARLYDNETAKAFSDMLPLTLDMNELNGNEKYYNLPNSLPADIADLDKINNGDIMLYGNDCLVLFYDSFSTSYRYTKIGYIENPIGLADAVGSGNIIITFEKITEE